MDTELTLQAYHVRSKESNAECFCNVMILLCWVLLAVVVVCIETPCNIGRNQNVLWSDLRESKWFVETCWHI